MILVTGGARSGKSTFAETQCLHYKNTTYIATARVGDDAEMKARIEKHKNRRPPHWKTVEGDRKLKEKINDTDAVLLDCVTVLISNYLMDIGNDTPTEKDIAEIEDAVLAELLDLKTYCDQKNIPLILVTNEVGSGIVPLYALSRAFRDIQGSVNQRLAQVADSVYLCVSGIPVKIK